MKSKILFATLFLIAGVIISSMFLYRYAIDIERPFPETKQNNNVSQNNDYKPIVYFGVVSRFSANIIYNGYQPLMDYLTENTPYRFELKLSNSYRETVKQLVNNEVSVAFLGSFIYLQSREKYKIFPILKPLNENGKPYFHSVLITKNNSLINSLSDLKNKKLALPSKQSFSGNWLPLYKMSTLNFNIEDLDSVHHFAHHHTVIHQILRNNFDVGVVKDRVAREYKNNGIRILDYSMPIPGSPIVISANTEKEIAEAIIKTLLNVNIKKEKNRELIKNWDKEFSYGFVRASESDYDKIEEILVEVGKANE
ncbi:MAG: phosphate/phosphite/phosphonate ABC transporter substrate-binding protein [Melioribacteraceae bacterium]|nr:phosphate/phosphite/phosphonate ABC transporter substrate-binding protein [Melioribacteraceae bacterium]